MASEEKSSSVKSRFIEGIGKFVPSALGLLALFILLRVYEIVFIWNHLFIQDIQFLTILSGLFYDLIFFLQVSAFLFIIYLLIILIKPKAALIVFRILATIIIFIYLLLVLYFSKSAIPLGSDLFGYSVSEIIQTVGSAGGFNFAYLVAFLLFIGLVQGVLIIFNKINLPKGIISLFYTLLVISIIGSGVLTPNSQNFANTSEYSLAVNKLQLFVSKSYNYFFAEDFEIPISNFYYGVDTSNTGFKYVDKNYPFLHEENSPDVLGNFFNIGEKKPNFIFLITESLGKAYSGSGAYLGSFTPFLDSLANQSLFWDNFLSCGGRTFAFPPSVFGSLPYAEKGFLELGDKMPPHFTIIKFLEKYGYKGRFFYGGDSHFDNMDIFFKRQGVSQIIDMKNFGRGYKKMPSSATSGFTWGYGDKELFKKYFEVISKDHSRSRIDVSMTLSIHSPFLVHDMNYYRKKVYKILSELNLSQKIIERDKSYIDQLACVLYTDDAYRYFLNEYKKRPDFNNTIFIITGDHRMPEIPISTQIDRFHVPFIIYSPMLKRTAKFSSISSQFDIAPSLLAFLKRNYGLKIPTETTFIGSGLDTTRQFGNRHSYPLMRNKNELIDYLYHDYFLSDKTLYRIDETMDLIPVDDQTIKDKIINLFDEFKQRNAAMLKTKKLIPPELIN